MTKIGERVGAILDANRDTKEVRFFGYGVYEGDHPVGIGDNLTIDNPRIKLDNGDVIWGFECWWGSEVKIKEQLKAYEEAGYKITTLAPLAQR